MRCKDKSDLQWSNKARYVCVCECVFSSKYCCAHVSSAPTFDYGDMPSPLSETDSTITVLLRPAQGRGAPVRWGDHLSQTCQSNVRRTRPLKAGLKPCVQHIPSGGWRRVAEEGEEGAGISGLFPSTHVPRWSPGQGHATLLHSRAAPQQPARGQSLHRGGQSHLQRLLEHASGSTQELPGLLPSYEQLQRGKSL